MGISYSIDVDPDTTAKAMLRDEPISPKDAKELARELKGRTAGEAIDYLEAVIDGEQSVPMRQHNAGVSHRSDIEGWDAGSYPEAASSAFLDLLRNGINNADNQGFEGSSMTIRHLAAHKVGEREGRQSRAFGRMSEWNTPEVDVELILEQEAVE